MKFFFDKSVNYIFDGWKFELIFGNEVFNVSKEIKSYIKNKILKVKNTLNISKLIKKEGYQEKSYYWRISNKYNKYWMPVTILGGTNFKLDLNNILEEKSLKIVYFINSDISPSYLNVMKDQIKDLIKSKIFKLKITKLFFIIVCSNLERRKKIKNFLNSKNLKNYINYEITFSNDSHKEYEGINKVWELSNEKSNKKDLILYFHAKGISYMQNKYFYIRQPLEKLIFKIIIGEWQKNIELITRFISIKKLGILSGGNGWLWFNFWIAKSSYISKLEKPVKRNRACYYEDWLGRYIMKSEQNKLVKYTNNYNESFNNTINKTFSRLSYPLKNKFNIGTTCKVEKGGFVGLGIVKYKYKLWYLFFVFLNKIKINNGDKNRFKFF